jgi:hypothetical protein
MRLVEPLAHLVPLTADGSPVSITVSDHDLGQMIPGADQYEFLAQAIKDGRQVTEEELQPFEKKDGRGEVQGLLSACPVDSLGWRMGLTREVSDFVPIPQKRESIISATDAETTFIHDHPYTYDFCNNPYFLSYHGSLSWDQSHSTKLRPVFQLSKNARSGDFLITPLEAFVREDHPRARSFHMPWEQKDIPKLFWRGGPTGDSYGTRKNYDWRRSHRPRLHLLAQNTTGSADVWVKRQGEWVKESWGTKRLNEAYMDVGLVGDAHRQVSRVCAELISAQTNWSVAKWQTRFTQPSASIQQTRRGSSMRSTLTATAGRRGSSGSCFPRVSC